MSTDSAPPQRPSNSKLASASGIQNLLSSWGVHWQYLAAGSLARASSTFVIFPLDVVKTRLQVQGAASHVQSAQTSGSNAAASVYVRAYKHPADAFRSIVKEEGVGALYRGMLPRLLYIAPAAAVSFTCYEMMKYAVDHFDFGFDARRIIDPDKHNSSIQAHGFLALGVATATWFSVRLVGTASRTPFDILKQHLQIQGLLRSHLDQTKAIKKQNLRQVFKTVVQQHGYRGLFDGYWATVCRDLPFGALYYTAYEVVKRGQLYLLTRSHDAEAAAKAASPPLTTHRLPMHPRQFEHEPTPKPQTSLLHSWNYMLAGACAGAFASSVTIPLDVVKTRLQTARYLQYSAVAASMAAQGHTTIPPEMIAKLNHEAPYRNMRDAFAKIWRAEGIRGLTSGLGPRLMYVIPGSALTFTFYEFYKRMLAQWTGEDFIEELPGRKDHSGGGV